MVLLMATLVGSTGNSWPAFGVLTFHGNSTSVPNGLLSGKSLSLIGNASGQDAEGARKLLRGIFDKEA
jgi:hypothetical protein